MKQEEKDKKSYNFQKLTPISNAELKIYRDALNFVFKDEDIKNVAISGPYSAGKSSVIESYKSESGKNFIHISLANFSETTESVSGEENNHPESSPKNFSTDKAILEGKILNQLIHQIEQKKIPQTKFKVKQKTQPKKIIFSAIIFTIFLLFSYYIYSFNRWSSFVPTLEINWIKNALMWTTSSVTLLFSGLACLVIFGITVYFIILLQKNNNILKRLKLQGNEIEIFEEKDDSFFDKYLNEVLYLFEQSGANAIVFEDMDRFNVNKIFEKLREINTLVNSKKAKDKKEDKKQPIRFIYLLRDDVFSSKDRTKFFDFILPVVPVIDGSNSFDQLIEHFKEGGIFDLFDENFLNELSLYIDDMRILKNIYNEFIIYHDRILFKEKDSQTEQEDNSALIDLDNNKLLGLIVYKNIFPKDFSDLHLRSGFVYTLFENKTALIKQDIERIDCEIDEVEEKIRLSENEMLNSIDELDAMYLLFNYYIVKIANVDISQFKNRAQLIKAMKENPNDITICNNRYNYKTVSDIASYLEELKQDSEYNKRKEIIERKNHDQIEKLKTALQNLKKQRSNVQNSKLKQFINKDNIDDVFNGIGVENTFTDIKGSNYFPLIKYLVRYGYIDESYSDYMTYFYENSLSRIDKNFLLSVTDQIPKDYSYSLNSPEKVLSRLNPGHFNSVEILNFDLLSHLLLTKSSNAVHLSGFVHQIKDTKNFQFIGGFLELRKEDEKELFIREINNTWSNIFHSIINESYFSNNQKKQYVVYSLYYSEEATINNLNKSNCLTDFISESHDFLDMESPDIEKLIAGFSLLGVEFEWIDYEEANFELFQEVYKNNLYKLSFSLTCLMLEGIYGLVKSDDFKNKNYTLVMSKQDEPLALYVNSNLNHYIKEILENCDERITDEESAALSIINHSKIDSEDKNLYIGYLETTIEHIDTVKNNDLWPLLLQEKAVKYSEKNILKYFFQYELDSCLVEFINESDHLLEFKPYSIDSEFGEGSASKFFNAIVNTNELINERYESILKTFDMHYDAFSNPEIEDEKIKILIEIDALRMTEKNLIFMRDNYSDLLLLFIKHNIRQYTENVINEGNLEMDELLSVLDENVEDEYKIRLLELTTSKITIAERDYSDKVKLHILENNFNVGDISFLLDSFTSERSKDVMRAIKTIAVQQIENIISEGYPIPFELLTELFMSDKLEMETKKELFAQHLPGLSEDRVVKCLQILDMKDFLSLLERRRPTFEINNVNKTILENFKRRKWITRFEDERGVFRANGRDRSDVLKV